MLLQLYVLYYGLADVVALGPWSAAILGLGLNYAAYEAEIYRGAIQAIPTRAVGGGAGDRHVATRRRCATSCCRRRCASPRPGVTNDFISLLKDSSLVSVLTVVELTKRMTITAVDNRGWLVPGALCAALYFLLGYPLARLARRLERHRSRTALRLVDIRAVAPGFRAARLPGGDHGPATTSGGAPPRIRSQRRARDHAAAAARVRAGAGARARRFDGGGRGDPGASARATRCWRRWPTSTRCRCRRCACWACARTRSRPASARTSCSATTRPRRNGSASGCGPRSAPRCRARRRCSTRCCTSSAITSTARGSGCPQSYHTRGFYWRIDHLYHLSIATRAEARRPLHWIKRGSVWMIDWRRLRA